MAISFTVFGTKWVFNEKEKNNGKERDEMFAANGRSYYIFM